MSYKLSNKSLTKLQGVHPKLVEVVKLAITLTQVDFGISEGLRSNEQQAINVMKGVSKTLNSKHLKQTDGYGHAVDLVPYINGKISWNLKDFYPIAESMRKACKQLNVKIRWGGSWDILNNTSISPVELVNNYSINKRKLKKSVFIDAPHFEIIL